MTGGGSGAGRGARSTQGARRAVGGGVQGGIPGEAAIFAVLGDPVGHSLSPAIHNAAFRAVGRPAVYVARRVTAKECGPVLRSLALAGGGGNVTVPHKEAVLPFLDRRTEAVEVTGACNTFWAEEGAVWGDNTDVEGFRSTWEGATRGLPGEVEVLVLGAGGAARAVLLSLLEAPGPPRIRLWNRTAARARVLAGHFGAGRIELLRHCAGTAPEVVVNATSAGLNGQSAPIDLARLGAPPRCVIDLVYGSEPTPLQRRALALGAAVVDGREMLVRQAEASHVRWFGEPPPRGVMTRALG